MEDMEKENILKEIKSIIGDDIYNEMKTGRKTKKDEKKSKIKREKKVVGGDEEDKRNEGDVGETCENKKDLKEEKREIDPDPSYYVINRKRTHNERTEKSDDHCENIELQDEHNVKEKHKKHKFIESWVSLQTEDNVCKFYFLRGKCIYGVNCFYSHDVIPLYKTSKLCKFQLRGKCTKSHCPFSHNTNMFYCRNDLIAGGCQNPSCTFKHVPLEVKSKDQKSRNAEVDQVLSEKDKNLFVFNNKNFIMNILIRNYFNFDSMEDVNLDEINKDENYPWYINCAIDLLKEDFQNNKIDYFYRLVKNYFKEKAQNILNYVDDEKLKLQVEQKMLPNSTVEDMLNNFQQKNTQQTETKCKTINVGSEHLKNGRVKNEHLKDEHLKDRHIKNGHVKNEHVKNGHVMNGHVMNGHIKNGHVKNGHVKNGHVKNGHVKNKHLKSEPMMNEHINSKDINSKDINSKDIKSPDKETDSSIYEYKVFSSDEDEDYSKYLNTYLEIST